MPDVNNTASGGTTPPPKPPKAGRNLSGPRLISPVQEDLSSFSGPSESSIWLTLRGYLRPQEKRLELIELEATEEALSVFEDVASMYAAFHQDRPMPPFANDSAASPREQLKQLISIRLNEEDSHD